MSLISKLYNLTKKDIKRASSVLVDAYSEDPMLSKIFKEDSKRRAQFKVMIKFCLKYGNLYSTSANLEGVMAIAPHDKDMSMGRILLSGGFFVSLKVASVGKLMSETIKIMEEAKEDLDIGPYIYLFIIGVSHDLQGKGYGGKLLRAIIEQAEEEKRSMYLETQKESNVSLYEKYGFYVYKKVDLPDPINLPMWLMVRDTP